ncbi:MAG TPA: hypothetical protein VMV22_07685 [Acidimicrobiales bacterium]|nr:hypothetical protein [Acidimicrobiales bacterium]
MTTRILTVAALSAGGALALAACGAGVASHVVTGATSPVTVSTSSTVTVAAGLTTAPGPDTPTTTASNGLTQHTLDQVAAELGALDNSLNTASSDLNNPQGDS